MIRIENITKSFGDKTILKRVTYHFPQGERIALIGANGQGKTTLLTILLNPSECDEGSVTKPHALRIGYLPQTPNPYPEPTVLKECMAGHEILSKIHEGLRECLHQMELDYRPEDYETYETLLRDYEHNRGYEWEGLAEKILLGLGFRSDQLSQSPQSLSGGWRMRLELARILVGQPDFMILDEPTNHLDLPSIEWLENYLLKFEGTLLLVSHDKALLNSLATITLYLNHGILSVHIGNFDDFIEQREQEVQLQVATVKKLTQRQARLQRFVDRFRAKPYKAGQVGSRKKMIDRLAAVISGIPQKESTARIQMPRLVVPPSGKDVLRLKALTVGYDLNQPLIRRLSLEVQRGQKIAIVGANGIGKSTLLKTIAGMIPSLGGTFTLGHNVQLTFFTQEATERLDKTKNVFATLQAANPALSEQTLRNMLGAFLFQGQDTLKAVSVLSGGEKSRLALACLLAQQGNLLLLDEPTNHLDVASINVLAEMINHHSGTILFVSHDRDFVAEAANQILEIGDSN